MAQNALSCHSVCFGLRASSILLYSQDLYCVTNVKGFCCFFRLYFDVAVSDWDSLNLFS